MKKIETFTSLEGRKLLSLIFKELRFDKQRSSFSTLAICWKICTREREINRYVRQDINVLHPLGFSRGTMLWMEEIVNRYYFSTINSFVYLGAAVLLVLIGIRRFSESVTSEVVLGGLIFEACMLVMMFIVMLFTPNDSFSDDEDEEHDTSAEELLTEIGEIARDFAAVVVQLEQMNSSVKSLIVQQDNSVKKLEEVALHTAEASRPNPKMIEIMEVTNNALEEFNNRIGQLNGSLENMREIQIDNAVKKELSRIISGKLADETGKKQ